MRRIAVLLIFSFVMLGSHAAAQWDLSRLGKGVKGGIGISDVAYHEKVTKTRTSYLAGGILNYRQNQWFTFQMEVLFTSKGYKLDDVTIVYPESPGADTGLADAEIILNYLEMPVLAKLSPPLTGKYRPYLVAGGFMALSIQSKTRLSEGLVAIDFGLGNVEKVDLGAVIGVGIDIKAGDGWVCFETRFDSSLMPAIKNEDQKSQVLFFQLGYWW